MDGNEHKRRWFWVTLTLSSISIVALVFGLWELVEKHFFRDTDYLTLHYLYISRGMVTSLLLAFWAAWFVLRDRRASEAELRRSRERYRGLLETSPGAVALYNDQLIVNEWNAAAERLYGFAKREVLGHRLPTVVAGREAEADDLLRRVASGQPVLDLETQRRHKDGMPLDVQLSLLPFTEASGQNFFLEVTADIRERVRLRQTLLEVEKLTTMGQMAAGTAHHLNTPLASMLLRLQMMRSRSVDNGMSADLERLETSARFCQQFVQRLLDFSRRPQSHKQPEPLGAAIESVVSFLSPQLLAKRARLSADLAAADGHRVLADRNQLEALFLILFSNSLDAIGQDGSISVRCRPTANGRIEIQIADDGCGIEQQQLAHIFEPFFTTKPPGKGTGLGLAIAGNILREHGGSVRLESAPGAGTTAYVELPVTHPAAQEASPA
jgi:PAS domain S-box-containing protein